MSYLEMDLGDDFRIELKTNYEELDKIDDYIYTKLAKEGWFDSKEEAEEWGGDVFYEAVLDYLQALGIILTVEEE